MFSRLSGSFGAGSHQPPPPPSPSRRGEYLQPGGGVPYGVPPPRGLQPGYGSPRGSGGYANQSIARSGHGGAAPGYAPGPGAGVGYQYGGGYGGRYSNSGGEYGGSNQYGGRGSYANGSYPAGIDPEYVSWFRAADQDQSGRVDARELQAVLSHSPYEPFSMRTIELMMELFDRRRVGTIGLEEFSGLMKYLGEWRVVFLRFDQDRSGYIDARELGEAFRAFGYSISPTLLSLLVRKFDRSGRGAGIALDNFIECCLIIKGLTDRFKDKDVSLSGSCTLTYEQFMLMVLPFVSGQDPTE